MITDYDDFSLILAGVLPGRMFRPVRWRSDRGKIKAVFKLQFHATQVQRKSSFLC